MLMVLGAGELYLCVGHALHQSLSYGGHVLHLRVKHRLALLRRHRCAYNGPQMNPMLAIINFTVLPKYNSLWSVFDRFRIE